MRHLRRPALQRSPKAGGAGEGGQVHLGHYCARGSDQDLIHGQKKGRLNRPRGVEGQALSIGKASTFGVDAFLACDKS